MSRASRCAIPTYPRSCAARTPGWRLRRRCEYLVNLGVTAVELLPVHHIADESFLVDKGLSNYWGYSSIGYLAPHAGYSSSGTRGEQLHEFKTMVKTLHRAGIEVIMDVVYNHTAEGNHLGPMLSFKGIDNSSYYRLSPEDPRYYMDFTGTGNSLNPVNPNVLRLIMDSLRYFVLECHVDGFRFDLAATLARELYDVDRLSAFFDIIHQDPILSGVKLIAEPWDVGPGGYQVGNFPILWTEWNGEYRDSIRDFWRGDTSAAEFAQRFAGSADLYDVRRPASGGIDQLHHRARRIHARRSGLLQRQAQRGQPRGQPGRRRRQPLLELRRRRPNRRRRDLRAAGPPAAQPPRHAPAVAGRSDASRWRRVRALPGRQQQRLVSGLGDLLVRMGDRRRAASGLHPPADRAAADQSRCFVAATSSSATRRKAPGCPTWSGSAATARRWATAAGSARTPMRSESSSTATRSPLTIVTAIRSRARSFLLLFNAHHEPLAFTVPGGLGDLWETVIGSDAEADYPPSTRPGDLLQINSRSLLILRRD